MNIPNHVAIILDGNGRWAKSKGMPRNYGHVQGAKNVEVICEEAYRMGISYLTVYAFSTENWNRPQDEVDALMKLLRNYMKTCLKTAAKNNMCVRVLGDKTRLDEDIRNRIDQLEKSTRANSGLHFQIALNYGGRDEICRAARSLAKQVQEALADLTLPIRIAVMGCVVNGPGEAREADLGIAGGNGEGLIFKKGEILYKVPEDQLLAALVQEARQLEQDAKEES